MTISLTRSMVIAVGLCVALLVGGCGGSSSGGLEVQDATGNVAVLITDAPTDIYEEIYLTITGISLLPSEDAPDAETITLSDEEVILDLLQLQNHSELFEVTEDVPIGDYAKVRMEVSKVELVDTDTDPETRVEAKLPSGHIDLLPRGGVTITEDNTIYVELDVDAGQSILVVETGSGALIFRPVVFVRTFGEGETADAGDGNDGVPLLSVGGLLRVPEDGPTLVCPSTQAAEPACVRLALNDDSAVFDDAGNPVGEADLVAGERVLAMGLLTRDAADHRRVLDVLSVVLGTRPTVGTRGGEADTVVDENGLFTLTNGRQVALAAETPVVDTSGTRLGTDAIVSGQGMTIMGIVGTEPLPATLVVLRGDDGGDDADASQTKLTGELIAVDTADTLQVEVNGEARPVRLVAGGDLVISGRDSIGTGALEDLNGFDRVRIIARGTPGESYFEATRIVAITLEADDDVVSDVEDEAEDDADQS